MRVRRRWACCLFFLGCATNGPVPPPSPAAGPASPVSIDRVQPAIERMVAPQAGGTPLKILAVSGPVRGWLAVAVSPPYREFPTVILFRLQPDGSWSRVFEALTPGVQGQRSALLDLHTTGLAVDMAIGKGGRVTSAAIADFIAVSRENGLATVAHAYFIHSHPAGAENYFVDRTATYDLARRLFPDEYDSYPRDECTMFDVPPLSTIDLAAIEGRLRLTAKTANGQTWVIGWSDVDHRGLLTGKTVDAR